MKKPVSVTRIETLIQEHGHALWLAMQSGEAGKYGVSCRTASQLMRCSKRTALAVMQALQDAGGVPAAAPVIGEAPSEPVAPVYTDEELIEADRPIQTQTGEAAQCSAVWQDVAS